MSNKLAFKNLHLYKSPTASGRILMLMNSKCDLVVCFLMMIAQLVQFIMPSSGSKLFWDS